MHILVIHPGALGDTILALPALGFLKRAYPQAKLTLAGNTDFMAAVAGGYSDACVSFSSLPLYRLYEAQPFSQRERLVWHSYDRIVSWTGSADPQFSEQFKRCHPCVRVVPWKPSAGETRHVSRIFLESLYPWISVQETVPPPEIRVSPSALILAQQNWAKLGWDPARDVVALHAGAGSVGKRWGPEHLKAVASQLLKRRDWNLLVIEGPAEAGLGRAVAEGSDRRRLSVAESLPLPLVAAMLSRCRIFIGADSGVAHLAAGLGVASVVLFGPTEPCNWAPLGRQVAVLRGRHGRVNDISPADLLHVVDRVVETSIHQHSTIDLQTFPYNIAGVV